MKVLLKNYHGGPGLMWSNLRKTGQLKKAESLVVVVVVVVLLLLLLLLLLFRRENDVL